VVPAPEAFSRHSGTCRLLGDRKHPPAPHTLQVGDFLRVGSVGVVVIETHNGVENRVLSEEKIQKIMKDTTNNNQGFLDLPETDGGTSLFEQQYSSPLMCICQLTDNFPLCKTLPQKTQKILWMKRKKMHPPTGRLRWETNQFVTCVLMTKTRTKIH